jgi:hypothetical protein
MILGKDYVDAYLIRETHKARLMEFRHSEERIWVPKSVTEDLVLGETPPELEGKLPGTPALIKVADWFVRKNRSAFSQ